MRKRLLIVLSALSLGSVSFSAQPITGYVQINPPNAPQAGGFNTQSGQVQTLLVTGNSQFTKSGLIPGQCLGLDGAGNTVTYVCGGGGGGAGGSSLGVNFNGVLITSPTSALNFLGPPFKVAPVSAGTTAQFTLDASSVTLYGPNIPASSLTGTVAVGNLPATIGYTNAINTWNGTQIFPANVILSSGSQLYLSNASDYEGVGLAEIKNTAGVGTSNILTITSGNGIVLGSSVTLTGKANAILAVDANGVIISTPAFSGILPIANGGNGTATPGILQGSNVTITGSWPNQTINASASSSGGGPLINTASQNSIPFYSASGSSNTLSGSINFNYNGTTVAVVGAISAININTSTLTVTSSETVGFGLGANTPALVINADDVQDAAQLIIQPTTGSYAKIGVYGGSSSPLRIGELQFSKNGTGQHFLGWDFMDGTGTTTLNINSFTNGAGAESVNVKGVGGLNVTYGTTVSTLTASSMTVAGQLSPGTIFFPASTSTGGRMLLTPNDNTGVPSIYAPEFFNLYVTTSPGMFPPNPVNPAFSFADFTGSQLQLNYVDASGIQPRIVFASVGGNTTGLQANAFPFSNTVLTLPASLPATTLPMVVSSTGQVSASGSISVSTITGSGSGNWVFTEPQDPNSYQVLGSSTASTAGQCAQFTSSFTLQGATCGGGGGTPAAPLGSVQYNSASAFAAVPGAFVGTSSITFSTMGVTGPLTMFAPNPANFFSTTLSNTLVSMRFFQSGVDDNTISFGSSAGMTVPFGTTFTNTNAPLLARTALISAPATASPALTAPGILDLWAVGATSPYISWSETGVANDGTMGWIKGGGHLKIYSGSETFGSGTELLDLSNAGSLTIDSTATVKGQFGAIDGSATDTQIVRFSTAATGPYAVDISTTNHLNFQDFTSSPTLSSCGTAPSFFGSDNSMTITPGSTAGGCTVTFGRAYVNTPVCIVEEETFSLINALAYSVTKTAITITQTSLTSKLDIHCFGRD